MILCDSRVLLWWGTANPGLGARTRAFMQEAAAAEVLAISQASWWQMVRWHQTNRLHLAGWASASAWLRHLELALNLQTVMLSPVIMERALHRTSVSAYWQKLEPSARYILATAIQHRATLLAGYGPLQCAPMVRVIRP